MSWLRRLFLISLILLGSCQTAPDPGDVITPLPERRFDLLGTARKNIAIASPDTLLSAISLLSESEEGNSETGQDLLYLSSALMKRVYPRLSGNSYLPPGGSLYPSLFAALDQGDIPAVPSEKVTFFTSLITPLALLNSRSASVLAASREVLGQLRLLNPQSVLPLYLQGALAEKEGDLSEALASYEAAVTQDPSCYPAEIGAARVSLALRQPVRAVEYLIRLNLRFPEDRELTGLLGEGYYQQGAYEKAQEVAAGGLTLWPDDGALLFLRARVLERLGRFDTARRLLTVVEGKIPPGAELQLLRARLAQAAGDLDSALNLLKKGRELYPEHEIIETFYGELLIISGKPEEGREILGRRLEGNPDSLETLKPLLKDAVNREDWDLAADYSRRILALEENRDNLIQGADIARRRGDRQEEARLMDRMVLLFSGDPRVVSLNARYLIGLNREREARTWLEESLKPDLNSTVKSEIHYLLSLTYPEEENRIDQLRTALLENLENIPALLALSDIYIGRGDFRIAQRYLRQAVILDPDNAEAQKSLADVERKLR